jgi:hypothetical protein
MSDETGQGNADGSGSSASTLESGSSISEGNLPFGGAGSRFENSVDLTAVRPQKSDSTPPSKEDKAVVDKGQGEAVKPSGEPKKDGQGKEKSAPAPEGKKLVDERHAEMLRSKGFDPEKIGSDPESLNKFLDNYANLEKEFTKTRQAAKTADALKEAESALPAKKGQEPAKVVTPLDEFEQAWDFTLQSNLAAQGVKTLDELWQNNPAMANYLNAEYVKGRQKAFEDNIAFQQTQASQKFEEEKRNLQYQNDLREADSLSKQNIAEAKKAHPELEKMFTDTGVEAILKHLEDAYYIPRSFILSNKAHADFLVKAAHAINVVANMDAHDENVRKEYLKNIETQKKALLPSSSGEGVIDAPSGDKKQPWNNSSARGQIL